MDRDGHGLSVCSIRSWDREHLNDALARIQTLNRRQGVIHAVGPIAICIDRQAAQSTIIGARAILAILKRHRRRERTVTINIIHR